RSVQQAAVGVGESLERLDERIESLETYTALFIGERAQRLEADGQPADLTIEITNGLAEGFLRLVRAPILQLCVQPGAAPLDLSLLIVVVIRDSESAIGGRGGLRVPTGFHERPCQRVQNLCPLRFRARQSQCAPSDRKRVHLA